MQGTQKISEVKAVGMEKLFDFPTNPAHYKAQRIVIWCFDDRFDELYQEYKRRTGGHVDQVKWAGGAKDLIQAGPVRDAILGQIKAGLKLHGSEYTEIDLMDHAGCGAYGKTFPDKAEERAFYEEELKRSRDVLLEFFAVEKIDRKVNLLLADFDGLYRVA